MFIIFFVVLFYIIIFISKVVSEWGRARKGSPTYLAYPLRGRKYLAAIKGGGKGGEIAKLLFRGAILCPRGLLSLRWLKTEGLQDKKKQTHTIQPPG
jgi:hypothetical protein